MLIGVVSDTHNNLRNIERIIDLFNNENLSLVIHTGDISNAKSLESFSQLNCELIGVYGNNDRNEISIKEVVKKRNFHFQEPPNLISKSNRNIAIFHEPDSIKEFLNDHLNIDLVLHGHTHRYRCEKIGDALIFNPGECAGMIKGKNSIGVINLENLNIRRIFF